jgi:hypothetical protein
MTPDEILRLRPARKQRFGDSERIVAPGQMLIFVSGQYPILGTQLLYFSDPVLSQRAQIPPPESLHSLSAAHGGEPREASPMEIAFMEEVKTAGGIRFGDTHLREQRADLADSTATDARRASSPES